MTEADYVAQVERLAAGLEEARTLTRLADAIAKSLREQLERTNAELEAAQDTVRQLQYEIQELTVPQPACNGTLRHDLYTACPAHDDRKPL